MCYTETILMEEEYWANSQFSVARYYGGININGKQYIIVNKEGKDLWECSEEAEKAGCDKAIEPGEPADLILEQMQHLKELGVDTSKASCYWWYAEGKNYLYWGKCSDINGIPTFNLQDMLEMIPESIEDWFIDSGMRKQIASFEMYIRDNSWHICYTIYDDEVYSNNDDDLLNCTYETLCWLAENNYIGGEK